MKLLTYLLLLCLPIVLAAQPTAYRHSTGTTLSVKGTSTLHDWTMTSTEATVQAGIEQAGAGDLAAVSLTVPVASLKSGKGAMDRNAQEALKAKQHPDIRFALKAPVGPTTTGSTVSWPAAGTLTIAGVSRDVTVAVSCTRAADGSLTCTGSVPLKMTDYGVKPPVLMMGTLKTGNDVTVDFSIRLAPQR